MTGEGLGGLGMDAASGQVADERMPQGMEIRKAVRGVLFGDARRLQVLAKHANHFPSHGNLERQGLGRLVLQVLFQQLHRRRPKRQGIVAAALGVGGGHGDVGRLRLQLE
ncbi:MAG TPA: hypothetical protein VHQ47_13370 [Phycisphaerae bacterium]|nr:hypothetical protein [Phycisphaerae bacterium]